MLLLFSLLVWSPYLLCGLVAPYTLQHLSVSPPLRTTFALSALIWALLALCCALPAWLLPASPKRDPASDPASARACVLGSAVALVLVRPELNGAFDRPLLEALVSVLCAAALGACLALLLRRLGSRPWMGRATIVLALAWTVIAWERLDGADHDLRRALILASQVAVVSLALERPRARRLRAALLVLFALALPAGLLALAAQRNGVVDCAGPPSAAAPSAPNVLMVVIDTWRHDHTGPGGYERATSPAFERLLAGNATHFSEAHSGATSTVPSIKGLLTGRPASTFGPGASSEGLPRDVWTLAMAFHEAGFNTAGFSANGLINPVGFGAGFEASWACGGFSFLRGLWFTYEFLCGREFWEGLRYAGALRAHKTPGSAVRWLGADWLRRRDDERPFFLYLHLIEPHWPYHDYGHGFATQGPEGEQRMTAASLLQLVDGAPENAALRDDPRLLELVQRYDEGVREADEILGGILDDLSAAGLGESTLVIVLGDHGEELLEHDGFGHGHDVHDVQTHVPLAFAWPADARFEGMPAEVDAPVSLLDVMPTLEDYFGLPAGHLARAEPPWGRSLRAHLEGAPSDHPVVAESFPFGRMRASYRLGNWKLRMTFGRRNPPMESEDWCAYDLSSDPSEHAPVTKVEQLPAGLLDAARVELQRRWEPWRGTSRLDDEEVQGGDAGLQQLKNMGYAGDDDGE